MELSAAEARWVALEAQGLSRPRPAVAGPDDLLAAVRRLGVVQLDAVNVLARTQHLVPFSRIGAYDASALDAMNRPSGELLEYWGHAASLQPVELQPALRWRMERYLSGEEHGPTTRARVLAWREAHADYLAATLAEVAAHGPLTAGQLQEPRRRDGEWWDRRSIGRVALESLFACGLVAAYRNARFERVYDLPERTVRADVLAQPTPPVAEAQRALVLTAAEALGVATLADLDDHFRIGKAEVRARVAELVEAGELVEVAVEGWGQPAWCRPGMGPRPPEREGATLLSPFDSLIWFRERTQRLFGFEYRIEIYVPEPKRRYGYYVLPVLVGDRLVARVDLKADRRASALLVPGAFAEPGVDLQEVAAAAAAELGAMAAWLGLASVSVGARGDLAPALRKAVPRRRRSGTSRMPG